jgi:alpha-galactosidase
VVARDRGAAVYCWARVATSPEAHAGRVALPGLAPDRDYRVRLRTEIGRPHWHQSAGPAWAAQASEDWVPLPGAVLALSGLPMPTLNPQQAMLIEVRAA